MITNRSYRGVGMTSQRTRDRLVETLRVEGISDATVLDIISEVPRHIFVDEALASRAYENNALPIGHGQTISQPYIVARMTEAMIAGRHLKKVLEIGTGCGYQAAVLSHVADTVYSIERLPVLASRARERMHVLGIGNVRIREGDGFEGWTAHAPYDGIIVTAAPAEMPETLKQQLADGGRMLIPVGEQGVQRLMLVRREGDEYHEEVLELVRFVPMLAGSGPTAGV